MKPFPSLVYLPFVFPGLARVGCAFTTRMGGSSLYPYDRGNISLDVDEQTANTLANRKGLALALGFSHWQEARQVHGTDMLFDPEPSNYRLGPLLEADGLATVMPGQALVIKTADCQPILLAHKDGKHIAALHVGWRGNVAGFIASGVAAFCGRYNLDPAGLMAVRGPSLGPSASQFVNFGSEFGDDYRAYYDEAAQTVDLWRLTRDQLTAAGLHPGNIFGLDLCTHGLPDLFFSYRRNKVTGRQAGIIWIRKG